MKDIVKVSTLNPKGKFREYPAQFDVRFAEHTNNLLDASLQNIESCVIHWEQIISELIGKSKKSKQEQILYSKALGFLKIWKHQKQQLQITAMMRDICGIFQALEKQLQNDDIIIPDVIKYRDQALKKLEIIADLGHMPGGKLQQARKSPLLSSDGDGAAQRSRNSLVPSLQDRDVKAVLNDIVESSKNALNDRLNEEQQEVMKKIMDLVSCATATKFVRVAMSLFEICPVADEEEFVNAVVRDWENMHPPTYFQRKDYGVKLQYMAKKSSYPVQDFLCAFLVVCPHSMAVERCVSAHNLLFSDMRTSTKIDTLNNRLFVYYNGRPTAEYDARPVLNAFLNTPRRNNFPDVETFSNRKSNQRFFKGVTSFCSNDSSDSD